MAFVSRETIAKVLEACPDAEWRLRLCLARYAGMRTPSESLELRWSDVDWDGKRLTITSPKTKKQGKAYRTAPLFPEVEEALAEAFDQAPEGAVYCINRYRSQDVNLRTHLLRIIRRLASKHGRSPGRIYGRLGKRN